MFDNVFFTNYDWFIPASAALFAVILSIAILYRCLHELVMFVFDYDLNKVVDLIQHGDSLAKRAAIERKYAQPLKDKETYENELAYYGVMKEDSESMLERAKASYRVYVAENELLEIETYELIDSLTGSSEPDSIPSTASDLEGVSHEMSDEELWHNESEHEQQLEEAVTTLIDEQYDYTEESDTTGREEYSNESEIDDAYTDDYNNESDFTDSYSDDYENDLYDNFDGINDDSDIPEEPDFLNDYPDDMEQYEGYYDEYDQYEHSY